MHRVIEVESPFAVDGGAKLREKSFKVWRKPNLRRMHMNVLETIKWPRP